MSFAQKVILTTLPRGVEVDAAGQTRLLLSVFVSPRLTATSDENLPDGETVLDKYKDFLDWPLTLSKLRFKVALAGQSFDEPARVERAGGDDAPRSELWKALFSSSTLVRSYVFDKFTDRAVRSFPVKPIETFLKERYGTVAAERAAPTRCTPRLLPKMEYPVTGSLFSPTTFGALTPQSLAEAKGAVEKQLQTNKAFITAQIPNLAFAFALLACFHEGTHYTKDKATDAPPQQSEPPKVPVFDFHQMVSSLGDYPHVMRRLGLVIDLAVTAENVPPSGRVGVSLLDGSALQGTTVTPLTMFEFDAARRRFAAAPKEAQTSVLRDGMLRLDDESLYGLVQVDVDGAAIKLLNYVEQAEQAMSHPSTGTPQKSALPALRSAGISLVKTDHAFDLVQTFDISAQNDAKLVESGQPEITLSAEQLVRGYRVDVREAKADAADAPWRSLCWRSGTYRFLNDPALPQLKIDDEGIVDIAATESTCGLSGGASPDLKLHESMFRWAGWSLSVPKPLCPGDPLSLAPNTAQNSFNFRASFDLAAGEDKLLPRLRFGNRYQMRVRTVDLAGNSLPPQETAAITTKRAITYGRFEPVNWPLVLLREAVSGSQPIPGKEGESVHRLVVRSDFETPTLKANETSERHIVPARSNSEVAEIHGMFDKADGTGLDKNCFKTIAGKNGALAEVEPAAQLTLPYLPDPLAFGATFLGLPGQDLVQVSFRPGDTQWPDLKPFRLRVVGVPDSSAVEPPDFSEQDGARVLSVSLPQAEVVRVRLSTYLTDIDSEDYDEPKKVLAAGGRVLNQLGLWPWMEEWVTTQGANPSEVENWLHLARLITLTGLHWMVTPYRELVLVHAVGRPLTEPTVGLTATKDATAMTFARLGGQMVCDGKSTGKLDVLADWEEPRDDPHEPQPHAPSKPPASGMSDPVTGQAHVLEIPINLPEIPFNQDVLNELALAHAGQQIGTFNLAEGIVTLTNADLRHEFGDTKSRLVNYSAVATTRFREYFPPSKLETEAEKEKERQLHTRTSAKLSLRINSSARPEAPKVLYIIPAFRWTKSAASSQRHGGGLRVYMERGWYSSGDGELLGVVLSSDASASSPPVILDDKHPLKPFVSQWGADPLRASAGTNGLLAPEHFTNALKANPSGGSFQTTGLSLDELPGGSPVSVAPHAVGYDEVRRLWYCDIEINPGDSYFPFVRLALARYQPNSIAGVHLSRVVLADFVQLAPGRTVSVSPFAGTPPRCNVTVTGKTYSRFRGAGDAIQTGGTSVTATVETVNAKANTGGRRKEEELEWIPGNVFSLQPSADAAS
ncbi:MAG TPA: hypothetical protein VGV59_15305, partial [Pyrinomonadaceae bacterium]|nr:hypothetical protein [Pyrinomonadaceae bacterium]